MLAALIFYLFAAVLVGGAIMVITVRNPVHSVLFLILCFFNAAGLFILLGAEFLAFLITIVYVGAVAVLFLFVVMMLDINFAGLRQGAVRYAPIGAVLGGVLLVELIALYRYWQSAPTAPMALHQPIAETEGATNTHQLGQVLYTDYIFAFQMAGLILLVAMVGAIVLSLRFRAGVRRQSIAEQNSRRKDEVLKINKITPGTGV